jgi:hypothetical protein
MALRPKGAARPDPAPDGFRVVQLIHPATFPEDVKNPAGVRLTVPENIADMWETRGIAMAID